MSKIENANVKTPLLSSMEENEKAGASSYSALATAPDTRVKSRASGESPASDKNSPRSKKLRTRLKFWKRKGKNARLNRKSSLSRSRESLTASGSRNRLSNISAQQARQLATQPNPTQPRNFEDEARALVSNILQNPGTREEIKKQFLAPLAKLDTEISVVMLNELSKADGVGMEAAALLLERIKSGESIDKVVPNFKFKIEFKTLQDVQKFIGRLENNEREIANLLVKIEDGSDNTEDRVTLSKLIRQTQADIGVANTHINDTMAHHMRNGDLKIGLMISLEAMKQRTSAHYEVCTSFASRYGDSLPEINYFSSLDDDNQNLINLSSLSEALASNSSLLREEGDVDSAQKIETAYLKVQTKISQTKKNIQVKKTAIEGGHDLGKRLAKKISQNPKPINVKLDLPADLTPTKEQIKLARSILLNKENWPEVNHGTLLLNSNQKEQLYTSILTPASAPNGAAKQMSPSYSGSASVQSIANIHAPNLATVQLQNNNGRTIYASTRHAALDPTGINEQNLGNLSKENTELILERGSEGNVKMFGDMKRVRDHLTLRPDISVKGVIKNVQRDVADNMAKELIKTQLLSDELLYREALNISSHQLIALSDSPPPKPLDKNAPAMSLPINAINLMGKSNSDKRTIQLNALRRVAAGGRPVNVQIVDQDGRVRDVPVRIQLREFNFNLASQPFSMRRLLKPASSAVKAGEWGYVPTNSNKALSALLGRKGSSKIGGEVEKKLAQFDLAIKIANQELANEHEIISTSGNEDSEAVREAVKKASAKQKEIANLESSRARLSMPAEQLKKIWRSGSFRSQLGDNNKFTARLSLLCSELGQPAIISDVNGMDRVNGCDAEAQYLAAKLDAGGTLPLPDNGDDRLKRGDFLMAGGGIELHRYNGGLVN